MSTKTVVAIAGAGDLAKYIVEEAIKKGNISVVVLTREKKEWFETRSPDVTVHVTDYCVPSIVSILDSTGATSLFSVIHSFESDVYLSLHRAMLEACKQSKTCKRYSPSYYGGNIDLLPGFPRVYKDAHQAFVDEIRENAGEIEWTVILQGWIMDYIIIFEDDGEYSDKSYMKAVPALWPIDMKSWKITIPGNGNEPAAFASARDVAKAAVALATTSKSWDAHTYVLGEQITWNVMVEKLEKFYGRKFEGDNRKYRPLEEIQRELDSPANQDNYYYLAGLQADEWTALGGQSLPLDVATRQRNTYFEGIRFRTVDEFLADSKTMTIV